MMALLAIGLVAVGVPQGSIIRFKSETGSIIVRNYAAMNYDTNGSTVVKGSGAPMVVEETGRGLLISGENMEVTISTLPGGASVLEQARVNGGGKVVLNDQIAYQSAVQAGKTTPKPSSFSRTEIVTNDIGYARDGNEGLLILPEAVAIVSITDGISQKEEKGAKTLIPFTQTISFSGTQAQITLNVSSQGVISDLKKAHLEGPVPFKLDRSETVGGAVPKVEVTRIDGKSDQFDAAFAGQEEPTLTATGHVEVKGIARGNPIEITGDQAVITLDKDRKPLRYRFVGAPTFTKIKPSGGSR